MRPRLIYMFHFYRLAQVVSGHLMDRVSRHLGVRQLSLYRVWSPFEVSTSGFSRNILIKVNFDPHLQKQVTDLLLLDEKVVTFELQLIILILNLFAQGELLMFKILVFYCLDLFDGQVLFRNMLVLFFQKLVLVQFLFTEGTSCQQEPLFFLRNSFNIILYMHFFRNVHDGILFLLHDPNLTFKILNLLLGKFDFMF